MGAEHFRELARARETVEPGRAAARLEGEHLALCEWTVAAGERRDTPLDDLAECFVVPRAGAVALVAGGSETNLVPGQLAYLAAPAARDAICGEGCRFLVAGWRREGPPGGGPAAGAPRVYTFADALAPSAPGWRFFSVDGRYLTVGCSYREAPPPARERPHSHDGEQINVPLEGRFAFTVGDHTETITPGWAALTPRGVLHTGLHLEFPYFQLIFATPPRGQDYAAFLRSIYSSAEY